MRLRMISAVVVHDARRQLDHLVEHFLMAVALRHHGQHFAEQRREMHRAHALGQAAVDHLLNVFVAQHLRGGAHRRRRVARDRARVVGVGQPFGETPPDLHRPQTMLDHLAREKIPLDERAERSSDAILFRRHDRRVRNRNAERMPEERGDGEPVGQPADHARFHRRANDRRASASATRARA